MTEITTHRPSVASAFREGLLLWYPIFGSIAMWAVHLLGLASLTRWTCTTRGTGWLHVITVVTGLGTVLGIAIAWHVFRSHPGDETADTDPGRRRFLGLLGLIVAAANLLLILGEEGMVFGFMHHRCG